MNPWLQLSNRQLYFYRNEINGGWKNGLRFLHLCKLCLRPEIREDIVLESEHWLFMLEKVRECYWGWEKRERGQETVYGGKRSDYSPHFFTRVVEDGQGQVYLQFERVYFNHRGRRKRELGEIDLSLREAEEAIRFIRGCEETRQ